MKGNDIVFGRWEATAIIINAVIAQVILNFPRSMAEIGGNAGWITAIYICILAFVGFYVIQKLYSRFEGKDLLEIGEHVGGNIGRIIMGLILLTQFIFAVTVLLREFSENMKVISLEVSPISFVSFFFLVGMVISAYAGLEAIVRFTAIAVPIVIAAYTIIIIGVAPYFDYTNLLPVLGTGPVNLFGRGFLRLSSFSSIVILLMVYPFIKTHKNFKRAGYLGIGISAFLLISSALVYLLVFGYKYALESFLPIFQLSRLINYGRFFQRIESIFVLTWAAVAFMYLSVAFYFTIYIFKKTFKLDYIKPLIFPFAILLFALSMLPENLMTAISLENMFFRNFAWAVPFGVVIILLIIARFIKRDSHKKNGGRIS